jgi:hypothetical protein
MLEPESHYFTTGNYRQDKVTVGLLTGWFHMRRRVEGLHITARVDNRGELLLPLEEESVSITVKRRSHVGWVIPD